MSDVPDVLLLPIDEARCKLAEAGYTDIVEVFTEPPRGVRAEGMVRVVRQREKGDTVELVVARFPELRREVTI
jgi:hypothetical protein